MNGAPPVRESPYVGLEPFSEADAAFFFGRDAASRLIIANLRSKRLTLVYGASGVGKSSILRAGVMRGLGERLDGAARRRARATGAGDRAPRVPFSVATFGAWRDGRPLPALLEAIRTATQQATGAELAAWDGAGSALPALRAWSQDVGAILVVLDQFEEYFLYNPDEDVDDEGTFAGAFPRILADASLPVNVVVALREDALAKLDRFKGRVPDLFANYLRLRHLDLVAARQAIEGPIAAFNALAPAGGAPVAIEPQLVDAVLAEVGGLSPADGDATIETPFLQLVMGRLWDAEVAGGSRTLRAATLRDLGGAEAIVRDHLERALMHLDAPSHAVVADIFRFLVTPARGKIALRVSDLAHFTDRSPDEIRRVLGRIAGGRRARVLRPLPPAPGDTEERYELFHDVLAEPILEWRRQVLRAREQEQLAHQLEADERERLAAARAEHAARFNRLVRWSAAGLLALAAGLAVAVAIAVRASERAQSRALATASAQQVERDPELAVVLARMAWETAPLPVAERALRDAVGSSRDRGRIAAGGGARADVVASPDGRFAATVAGARVRLWDARARAWLDGAALAPGGPVRALLWSADGRSVAAVGRRRVLVRRAERGARALALTPAAVPAATALSGDGRRLAVAAGRTVTVHDARSGAALATLRQAAAVTGVAFDPRAPERLATVACDAGEVRLWRWQARRSRLLRAPGERTTHPPRRGSGLACAATFSPDGRWLATALRTAVPRLWSGRSGAFAVSREDFVGAVETLEFDPASRVLAVATAANRLALLREPVSDGSYAIELPLGAGAGSAGGGTRAGDARIAVSAFAPDGRRLAVGTGGGLVAIVDVERASVELELRGHRAAAVGGVGFLLGGELASAAADGTIRRWDATLVANLRPASDADAGAVTSAAFDASGARFALAFADGDAQLGARVGGGLVDVPSATGYARAVRFGGDALVVSARAPDERRGVVVVADARTGAVRRAIDVDGLVDALPAPDGRRLVTVAEPDRLALLDGAGRRARSLPWPRGIAIASAALSGDGRTLLAAGRDGSMRLLDLPSGRTRRVLRPVDGGLRAAVLSADARTIAVFGEAGAVQLVDAAERRRHVDLLGHASSVLAASFSPDGRLLATGGADRSVRFWDARSGRQLGVARVHADSVNAIAFDPADARAVLTASNDGSARRLRCTTCGPIGDVLALARRADARRLTASERRDLVE